VSPRQAWHLLGFLRDVAQAKQELRKEAIMAGQYDWTKSLWKALRVLGAAAAPVLLAALAGFLSDPVALTAALATLGWAPKTVTAVVAVLLAVGEFLRNRQKHKNGA
jgi:hypothetical protein